MGLRILVFEGEQSLRELLHVVLAGAGHKVQAFADPSACPLFNRQEDEGCRCEREQPCADALLSDLDLPRSSALDFLRLQRLRGCKTLDANKAVMSSTLTDELLREIEEFGGGHIKKPFRLAEILAWVDGCSERLSARKV